MELFETNLMRAKMFSHLIQVTPYRPSIQSINAGLFQTLYAQLTPSLKVVPSAIDRH